MLQLVAALTSLYDSLCRDYFPRDLDEISDCHMLLFSALSPPYYVFALCSGRKKKKQKKQQTNKPSI